MRSSLAEHTKLRLDPCSTVLVSGRPCIRCGAARLPGSIQSCWCFMAWQQHGCEEKSCATRCATALQQIYLLTYMRPCQFVLQFCSVLLCMVCAQPEGRKQNCLDRRCTPTANGRGVDVMWVTITTNHREGKNLPPSRSTHTA